MAGLRQVSFAAGELMPQLRGRTDLEEYAQGCARLYNFFVSKQGLPVSRPGHQYCGKASQAVLSFSGWINKPSGLGLVGYNVKLVPFLWSNTLTKQNYVLVFGERNLQIWKDGAELTFTLTGSIPYHASDLPKLRWAASGDVVTLTCAGYDPATLTRVDETHWTYAAIDFTHPTPSPALQPAIHESSIWAVDAVHPAKPLSFKVTAIVRDGNGVITESAPVSLTHGYVWDGELWSGQIQYRSGSLVQFSGAYYAASGDVPGLGAAYDPSHVAWWYAVAAYNAATPYTTGTWVTSGGTCYVALQDSTGVAVSNAAYWAPLGTQYQLDDTSRSWLFNGDGDVLSPFYPDRTVELWAWPQGALPTGFVSYRWYAGRAGIFGWIGDSATATFVYDGSDPDWTLGPPQGLNPFDSFIDGLGSTIPEKPISVCYYEDRRFFGGTTDTGQNLVRPMNLFGSGVGDYANFDQRMIPLDDDPLNFALAARTREQIRAMVPLRRMIVLTDAAAWAVSGSMRGPMVRAALTAGDVDAHVEVDIGADWPVPLIVGQDVLWVRNLGTAVMGAALDVSSGNLEAADLSQTAEHLFLGYSVADWALAERPWRQVWIARSDGKLLSLSYRKGGAAGWAWHELLGPGGNTAVVQSVCTIPEGDEDAVYVALQGGTLPLYDNTVTYNTGDLASYYGHGFEHAAGSSLGIPPNSDGTSNSAWTALVSSQDSAWICRFSTRVEAPGKYPVGLDAYTDIGAQPQGTIVLNGSLPQLEGMVATVVGFDATGKPVYTGTTQVTGGGSASFPLPAAYAKVCLGLPYNSELQLLPCAEARDKQKVVSRTSLELIANASAQVQAGVDLNHLNPEAVQADVTKVAIAGNWSTDGAAAFRFASPLPVTVLAVTREVAAGGR